MATTKRKRDGVKEEGGPPSGGDLEQFRTVLRELKTNAQSKIRQLTALAETHKEQGQELARILAEEVLAADASRLQPLFLVLDSIMKKLSKEYRNHLVAVVPELMNSAYTKADAGQKTFLLRIAKESWRKHELIPPSVSTIIDGIFAAGGLPPASLAQVKTEVKPAQLQPPPSSFVAVKDEAFAAAAAARATQAQGAPPPASAEAAKVSPPKVKGPPPKPPVKLEAQAAAKASTPVIGSPEGAEIVERRLTILTKIMERKGPSQEELREIMRVPEVMKAMTMQRQGAKTEAMALLAEYKAELEKSVDKGRPAADPRQLDPRQAAKPLDPRAVDPRQADGKSADPRQASRQKLPEAEMRPQDPRQAARQLTDPKVEASAGKRVADAQISDPRQKQAKVAKHGSKQGADVFLIDSDEEAPASKDDDDVEVVPENVARARILQGLPSLGFSEGWLRQFVEQMPAGESTPLGSLRKQPSVGRKVLGADGEQMVYVDEMQPSEILLLMQLVFLLEEKLRRSGASLDITQRIPHTFGYLQVEPAIDVMLKHFFDEVPHQCATTGLRFANREKLRKHNDALFRRKAAQQQRQRGAEARGWMETIPEWVGNRDLVVGPALFQLGGGAAVDEANAQRAQRAAALEDTGLEEDEEGSERSRWICPLDERRSVCPVSGEAFEREWSDSLNDWAFSDVVAVELGTTDKILRFPPKNAGDPERLSESALLFKKSCFLNTSPAQRLIALEECRTVHALGRAEETVKVSPQVDSDVAKETEQLATMLAEAASLPRRKFF